MHLFDTHLHVAPDEDPAEQFAAARTAGVDRFMVVGCDLTGSRYAHCVAAGEQGAFATAGVHPHAAASFDGDIAPFRELGQEEKLVAIGEIGLDFHYNYSPPDVQRRVFRAFLQLGAETGLPVVIHCREAYAELIALLREELVPGQGFEVHSFTGTPREAETLLEMGAYLSFNGMVTFKRADNIREALAVVPLERLLLESDSPYLAPVPYRGKRNQPAFLIETAKAAARLCDIPLEELAHITTDNGQRFFGLAAAPAEVGGKG